ncbi:HTH domain-containing protein [Singulisphaera sp. GP187]|uniref:helix-turn-helix transcriptional regulator n=1 Tax=Singulisphaera sp. GP187 TaxID=1882752 RepID=UPI00092C181D|nr:HTH domain-containing protein [Singulisphaera sp. GP187]SIO63235.1 HTH domain-containing protein [Singulisphaera sp. GP187]
MAKKRTDAERRVRQTDRLARVLRVLQLIQSPGPWTAESIAAELECSQRTVYRDLQTLSAAGVPWYFDDLNQSYRIREGYKGLFPHLQPKRKDEVQAPSTGDDARSIAELAKEAAQRLLTEAEGVVLALDRLSKAIDGMSGPCSG